MRKLMIATLATIATSGAALAQNAPTPATAAPAARPATAAPAPVAAPSASIPIGGAATAALAKQAADAKIKGRSEACLAKGPAYKWLPPHVIGDSNPKGGFYTSNFNGGCRLMSMKEAMDKGLITINATPRR